MVSVARSAEHHGYDKDASVPHSMTDNRSSRGAKDAMNPSRDEPDGLAPFIQICASQNDLFALDGQGNIYQYNFNATTWEKLAASRSHEGPERSNHTRAADTERSTKKKT